MPLRLRIDSDALVSNWQWLATQGGKAACGAAVKADGYGLGAGETVARLAGAGCRDFFVATWAEAADLMPLSEGLTLSVLHGVGEDDLPQALETPARPVLNSAAQVARWRENGGGRPCDVMVDTGMNRLGLVPQEAAAALDGLAIETLMSHLACADEPGHPLNREQLRRFESLCREIPARRYSLSNSAGICLGADYAFDLTRPGLALYGGIPVIGDPAQGAALRQVVRIEAQIIQVRDVPAGATVGYGATFTAASQRRVAIVNLGYADGYLRALGPSGSARAGGQSFPVVGRVSMDLLALDLTGASLAEGDWLEVDYRLPELAQGSGLSQYELLTGLGSRFERRWD